MAGQGTFAGGRRPYKEEAMRTSHRSPIVLGLVPALALVAILAADGAATGASDGSAAVPGAPAARGWAGGAARRASRETPEVGAVEIPVQVVRDGEPVRGLTAADFELYEGRKRQVLTGFDVGGLSIAAHPPLL